MKNSNKLIAALLLVFANSASATQTYNFEKNNQERISNGYFLNSQFGNLIETIDGSNVLDNDAFVTSTIKEAINSSTLSLSAWVRLDDNEVISPIITSSALSSNAKLALEVVDGHLVYTHLNSNGIGLTVKTEQKIANHTWTHIAAVSEYGVVELFINGQNVNVTTQINDTLTKIGHSDPFVIGGNLKTGEIISGEIDDVKIAKMAFTASELDCQFNHCDDSFSLMNLAKDIQSVDVTTYAELLRTSPEAYRGDTGDRGPTGRKGRDGDIGERGLLGPRGDSTRGARGLMGPPGPQGIKGNRGLPGRCIPIR